MYKTIQAGIIGALFVCALFFLMGGHSQNGEDIIYNPEVDALAEKHWYVKTSVSGNGDCTSWENACLFRTAVALTTDSVMDSIHIGPGNHDTDNGSDGNGTEIDKDYVRIHGAGDQHSFTSRFYNGDAAAVYTLVVTGTHCDIDNLEFTQSGQADVDVTHIYANDADYLMIDYCRILSTGGAASDIGVELTGGIDYVFLKHLHMGGFQDSALVTDDAQAVEANELYFRNNARAIYLSDANDDRMLFTEIRLITNTLGIEVDAGVENVIFDTVIFDNNTTNVNDDGGFDEISYNNVTQARPTLAMYPTGGVGTTVTGAAGAWTLGNIAQIVPVNTITEPFFITGISLQSAVASNTYELELYWSEAAGTDHTIGRFQFSVGTTFFGTPQLPSLTIKTEAIPANAYIGAKVASSSGGGDAIVMAIQYEQL